VCGPIESEESFKQIYHKELYESKNIYTIGWVDIASEQFMEICRQCVGLIYPSSSEGQCGGVVTSMHASLIPVVSYETGVDVDESYGVMLPDCTLSSITDAVRRIGEMPAERLATMARNAWDYARRNHTKERFAQAYREAVLSIREEFAAKSGVTRHK
jgi:glycosyltransferase involved in cell wall biosynthesis